MGNGIIKLIVDSILSVIYSREEVCILCGSYIVEEELICKSCFKKIEFFNKSSNLKRYSMELQCFSVAYYSGPIMELVRRLSTNNDPIDLEALAKWLEIVQRIQEIKRGLAQTMSPQAEKRDTVKTRQ